MQTNRIDQLPTNTVLHGDCISIMRSLPASSIDFILTDPPYLIRYEDREGRPIQNNNNSDGLKPASRECYRVLKHQHEQAYLLAKSSPALTKNPIFNVIDTPYSGNKLHPTQKPIAALNPIVDVFSKPGDIFLDPFCGSDSTLLAADTSARAYNRCFIHCVASALAQSNLIVSMVHTPRL